MADECHEHNYVNEEHDIIVYKQWDRSATINHDHL